MSRLDPWIPHVLPFVGWLFVMQMMGDPNAWNYTPRIVVGVALLFVLRPWRYYPWVRPTPSAILWSLVTGIAIFVLWVAPELPGLPDAWQTAYRTFGMQMPWTLTEVSHQPVYTGFWILPRMIGAALVIPVIEEFFWRGWLYRWIIRQDFLKVPHHHLNGLALVVSALFFASVHTRWVVAIPCGIAYGLLYIKTRNIWAAVLAHAVTNLLLGLYVLQSGQHGFW